MVSAAKARRRHAAPRQEARRSHLRGRNAPLTNQRGVNSMPPNSPNIKLHVPRHDVRDTENAVHKTVGPERTTRTKYIRRGNGYFWSRASTPTAIIAAITLISQCADLLYWHRMADCQPAFPVCDIAASGDIVPNAMSHLQLCLPPPPLPTFYAAVVTLRWDTWACRRRKAPPKTSRSVFAAAAAAVGHHRHHPHHHAPCSSFWVFFYRRQSRRCARRSILRVWVSL